MPVRSRSWLRYWFTRLAALAAVAFTLLAGAASAYAATGAAPSDGALTGHVVLVNIDGLLWSDVTQSGMPIAARIPLHPTIAAPSAVT